MSYLPQQPHLSWRQYSPPITAFLFPHSNVAYNPYLEVSLQLNSITTSTTFSFTGVWSHVLDAYEIFVAVPTAGTYYAILTLSYQYGDSNGQVRGFATAGRVCWLCLLIDQNPQHVRVQSMWVSNLFAWILHHVPFSNTKACHNNNTWSAVFTLMIWATVGLSFNLHVSTQCEHELANFALSDTLTSMEASYNSTFPRCSKN